MIDIEAIEKDLKITYTKINTANGGWWGRTFRDEIQEGKAGFRFYPVVAEIAEAQKRNKTEEQLNFEKKIRDNAPEYESFVKHALTQHPGWMSNRWKEKFYDLFKIPFQQVENVLGKKRLEAKGGGNDGSS